MLCFFLANALWEHLLCHGYSARDFFFFNLGMQINGMGKKMSRFLAEARVLPLILVGASRIDGKSG